MIAAHIAEPLPGNQAGGRTAPTSKRQAMAYLRSELGITGAQAHQLVVAYERDAERPAATAAETYAPSFIDWLMRQAPSARKPSIRKWQIGSYQVGKSVLVKPCDARAWLKSSRGAAFAHTA